MKKIILLSSILFILISLQSCKETPKKEDVKQTTNSLYSVDSNTTSISWTAYKTTSKVPVKGTFLKVELDSTKAPAPTALEAMNGLKFKIPVDGLFTKDSIRDGKLKKFFFGNLLETATINGEIHINNETSGYVDITMNGITQQLPITFVLNDKMVTIEALMDLDNWKAQAALTALNTVCAELHSGEDGISKTWSEVKIDVALYLKNN